MVTKCGVIAFGVLSYLSVVCAKVPSIAPTSLSCLITGNVTCSIKATGANCDSYTLPTRGTNCFDVPVNYKFTYCNVKTIPVALLSTKSYLKSEFYTYNFTNLTIPSGKCITQSNYGAIKTCSGNTYAALQLNGYVTQGSTKVWCFDYKYLKVQPKVGTFRPTKAPGSSPFRTPTKTPSSRPVRKPTQAPIISSPVKKPTLSPTKKGPTTKPTKRITTSPFRAPSGKPFNAPSGKPSKRPTSSPFRVPSRLPSKLKTVTPTKKPTIKPATAKFPTRKPTGVNAPTRKPTVISTIAPTASTGMCGISVTARGLSLTATVSALSNSTSQALTNSSSPQSLALSWLINQDGLKLCPGDSRIIQRFIMVVFYFSMSGDSTWVGCGRNSLKACNPSLTFVIGDPLVARYGNFTWLSTVDECKWGGLSCNDTDGTLDRIEFNRITANKLKGTLPAEITLLTAMRYLIIESCCSSSIPKYNASDFVAVQGKLPLNMGNLVGLRVLDLSYNLLSGSVPTSIANIPKLKEIDLNFNNFIGQFPSPQNATQLSKLLYVHLESNAFTGTVPNIGNAVGLTNFTLQGNKFSGQMPQAICNLITPPPGGVKVLKDLWADCLGSAAAPAIMTCTCCSKCFSSASPSVLPTTNSTADSKRSPKKMF